MSDNRMNFVKIADAGGVIPANTGFITLQESSSDLALLFNRAADDAVPATVTGNIIEGSTTDTECEPHTVLTLGSGSQDHTWGFWVYTGTKLSAWRTWIPISKVPGGDSSKGFELVFDDVTPTVIQTVDTYDESMTGDIFDLAGRRIARQQNWNDIKRQLPKGVYIVNGQKVVNN